MYIKEKRDRCIKRKEFIELACNVSMLAPIRVHDGVNRCQVFRMKVLIIFANVCEYANKINDNSGYLEEFTILLELYNI